MTTIRLAIAEFQRFRDALPKLALAAMTLVPLLYGSLYLWANWDPYGRTGKIPVAVINADQPTTVADTQVTAGDTLVARLKKSDVFNWRFVSADTAMKGVKNGTYYFTIGIPSDFSANLASPLTGSGQPARITMTLNDANGYIAGVMARTAQVKLEEEINAAAYQVYAEQALGGVEGLRGQLELAAQNASDLAAGVTSAADNAAQLSAGMDQLAAVPGIGQVPGANQLITGGQQLAAGLVELKAGAQQLADGLTNAAQAIPDADAAGDQASAASRPVDVATNNLNPVDTYGEGLAPFFISIALWVFSLAIYFVLRAVSPRALAAQTPAFATMLGGWLPAALVGTLGALVLFLVVRLGLGLDPRHLAAFLGLTALGVLAFVAIGQLLRLALGVPAAAASLVLLMLQLTSAGALYPVETTPLPFRVLHPLMPMSYLVDGLRVTIGGGDGWHLARAAIVLTGFLLVSWVLSCLLVRRNRTWRMSSLRPSLRIMTS